MLGLLRKRKMNGGLYFGPAGWLPQHWQTPTPPTHISLALPSQYSSTSDQLRPGRQLKYGEVIIQAQSPTEADLLSPLTGTIESVTDIDDLHGTVSRAVIIARTPDNPTNPSPENPTPPPALPQNVAALQTLLQRAGIGPCSPHTPSLLDQLADIGDNEPTAVLLNLLPAQPESRLPLALLTLETDRMLLGLKLLQSALTPRRWLAVLDRADWRLTKSFRRPAKKSGLKLHCMLNQYPQANPTVLIWTLFAQRLPVGHLPTQAGIIVIDPVTLWSLGKFAQAGPTPGLTERPVQIFAAGQPPQITKAPLGTRLTDLLTSLNIPTQNKQCIINGMLSGVEVDPAQAVIQPATASISIRDFPLREHPSPCFACGWCVDHCPTELNPINLFHLALAKDGTKAAEAPEALNCIACGLCTYVCPTRLPLAQEVVGLRGALRRQISAHTTHLPTTKSNGAP